MTTHITQDASDKRDFIKCIIDSNDYQKVKYYVIKNQEKFHYYKKIKTQKQGKKKRSYYVIINQEKFQYNKKIKTQKQERMSYLPS